MFNLFQLCRKDEISIDIVAQNGNNVEATFDIVERIVQLVAHCCWYELGFDDDETHPLWYAHVWQYRQIQIV